MSMPHEHTWAINKTYEFLKELRQRDDIPADVKESANWPTQTHQQCEVLGMPLCLMMTKIFSRQARITNNMLKIDPLRWLISEKDTNHAVAE